MYEPTQKMADLAAAIVEKLRADAEPADLTPGDAFLVLMTALGIHTGFYGSASIDDSWHATVSDECKEYFSAGYQCGRGMLEDMGKTHGTS